MYFLSFYMIKNLLFAIILCRSQPAEPLPVLCKLRRTAERLTVKLQRYGAVKALRLQCRKKRRDLKASLSDAQAVAERTVVTDVHMHDIFPDGTHRLIKVTPKGFAASQSR